MSFQEAAGGMGWTPDQFWHSTMPDFWRHHHGFYLFHGGKDEPEFMSQEATEEMMMRFPDGKSLRKRPGAKVITDAGEMAMRMRDALGD